MFANETSERAEPASFTIASDLSMSDRQVVSAFADFAKHVSEVRGRGGGEYQAGVSMIELRAFCEGLQFTPAEREHLARFVASVKNRGGSHGPIDLALAEKIVREAKPRIGRMSDRLDEEAHAAKRRALDEAVSAFG